MTARSITRPITELVRDSERLGGDTSAEFKTAQRDDEIGQVAARWRFRDNVIAQQEAAKGFAKEVEAREALNRTPPPGRYRKTSRWRLPARKRRRRASRP